MSKSGIDLREARRAVRRAAEKTGQPLDVAFTVHTLARAIRSAGVRKSRAYLERQIRGWAQRGLLESSETKGHGPTASRIFDADAAYRARLLSFLTGLGMSPEKMRPVADALEDDTEGESPLKRVRRHERVYMCVYITEGGEYESHCLGTDSRAFEHRPIKRNAVGGNRPPAALVMDLYFMFHRLIEDEEAVQGHGVADWVSDEARHLASTGELPGDGSDDE